MTISTSTFEKIKESLAREKTQIENALRNLKRDDPFLDPERTNDSADSGTDAFEDSEHLRIETQEKAMETQLSAIQAAEQRIANNTYGTCLSCGQPIDVERLIAMPTASVCISCEKKSGNN